MGIKDFKKDLAEIEQRGRAIKELLIEQIKSLPDNPDIQRLGDGRVSCFTMSNSKLINVNFSPGYYDFKKQYDLIISEIKQESPTNCLDAIDGIIETGKIKMPGWTQRLHPQVIRNLQTLMEWSPEDVISYWESR